MTTKARTSTSSASTSDEAPDSTTDREATGGTTSKETTSEETKAAEDARAAEAGDAPAEDARKVKYTGPASTREMTRAQWKAAGIDNQDTVILDEKNNFTLPASDFTEEALERLKQDPDIKITS